MPQAESRLPPGKLWPDRYPVPTKMTARKRFNLGYAHGAKPALWRMGDQEAGATLLIHLKFWVRFQESLNCGQRPRSRRSEHGKHVDNAVLHHNKAAGTNEAMVRVQFAPNMGLVMVAVQQHHDRAGGYRDRGSDSRTSAATELPSKYVTRGCDSSCSFYINSNNPSIAHEIEESGKKIGRSATIHAALDQERGPNVVNRLLDRPQVEKVLPDGFSQPSEMAEILCFLDEPREKLLLNGQRRRRVCGGPCPIWQEQSSFVAL